MTPDQIVSLLIAVGVLVLFVGITVLVVQVGAMFRSLGESYLSERKE